MSEWLRGDDKAIVEQEAAEFAAQGAPADLAYMVATGLYRFSLLDIIDVADITETDTAEVADTYFALMDRLGTDGLLTAVSQLPRNDRWHSLARLAIRDDIYASLRSLCFDVLAVGEPDESGEAEDRRMGAHQRLPGGTGPPHAHRDHASGEKDLATLSVAARQIRRMTRTSGQGSRMSREHRFRCGRTGALVGHRHVPARQPRHDGHAPRRGASPVPHARFCPRHRDDRLIGR